MTRKMRSRASRPATGNRRGFSLIEVLMAVTIFTCALLGLAAAAAVGIRQTSRAREDSQYWADAQQVMDSLMAKGWGSSSLVDGSTTVRGRSMTWTVGSSTSNPQQIPLSVARNGYSNRFSSTTDVIVVYLSKAMPGS